MLTAEKNPLFGLQEDNGEEFTPVKMSTENAKKNLNDLNHLEMMEYAREKEVSPKLQEILEKYTSNGQTWCTMIASLDSINQANTFLAEVCNITKPDKRSELIAEAHAAARHTGSCETFYNSKHTQDEMKSQAVYKHCDCPIF